MARSNISHETLHTSVYVDTNMEDAPLAVRRPRRSTSKSNMAINGDSQTTNCANNTTSHAFPSTTGLSTPPTTPRHQKKRVRFSDPGPDINVNVGLSSPSTSASSSSGLTPFIRRTSLLNSPPPSGSRSKRRHSAPSPGTLWNLAGSSCELSPISGTIQFVPFRQVLSGRVKRRLRRNHLSEEVQIYETEKRRTRRSQIEEIERLRRELIAKDGEMRALREDVEVSLQISGEAGVNVDTIIANGTLVKELERQLQELRDELKRREVQQSDHVNDEIEWTVLAQDPFMIEDASAFDVPGFDDGMSTANDDDVLISTPSRRGRNSQISIPSPPATLPGTPCTNRRGEWHDASVQVDTPDPEKVQMERQLHILQAELETLRSSLEKNDDLCHRLSEKLQPYLSASATNSGSMEQNYQLMDLDGTLDAILTQLALSQSSTRESDAKFSAFSAELCSLGFSSSAEKTIQLLSEQFRSARLQLEYLFPGETSVGFEPAKLIDLLITRLKSLKSQVEKQESDIDQYHSLEANLRQQLGARVDAARLVDRQLSDEKKRAEDLETQLAEKDKGLERLKYALDGYREEVKGLEILVGKLEAQGEEKDAVAQRFRTELETSRQEGEEKLLDANLERHTLLAEREGQDLMLKELKRRLDAALDAAEAVRAEKDALERQFMDLKELAGKRESEHGKDLAVRDARVEELRTEVERVNGSLRDAWGVVKRLRGELVREKTKDGQVVENLKACLGLYGDFDLSIFNPDAGQSTSGEGSGTQGDTEEGQQGAQSTGVRMMNGMLARRVSGRGKKRRRYDSGLGFLEEEDELDVVEG